METMEIQTKTCTVCGKTLPITDFYRKSSSPDGYYCACKDCQKARIAKSRINKTEKNKDSILSEFSPKELIDELKSRGYYGELKYTHTIYL